MKTGVLIILFLLLSHVSPAQNAKRHPSSNTETGKVRNLETEVAMLKIKLEDIKNEDAFNSNVANSIQLVVMVIQLVIFIVGISQFKDLLKFNRREKIYHGFMELEREIDETNKDIWGLPESNTFIVDGEEKPIDLKKVSYMVRLIDLYSFERGHAKKYDFTILKENGVLYQMFTNQTYIDYWNYIVKKHFYFESRFCKVIDDTILEIIRKRS